jgi:hypothetical protein
MCTQSVGFKLPASFLRLDAMIDMTRFWPKGGVPKRPLFRRSWGTSGHQMRLI